MIGGGVANSAIGDAPTRFRLVGYLSADAGSFTLSGQDAVFLFNRVLEADAGSFTLTGQDATFEYINFTLTAEAGSFTLAGQDVDLLWNRVLEAGTGSFTLTGQDVDFVGELGVRPLARISVSRSGTSATVTLENFDTGNTWNIYRKNNDSGTGSYTLVKEDHATASYNDTVTSGVKYSWRAGKKAFDTVLQLSRPKQSNP